MNISVIIPVKNRADLLPITLDNILGQTLKPYEVIVVNDNSTDRIADVIAAYKSSAIFMNSKGYGPGAARNAGLGISTGNFIQFFDSDDLMTKNKLQVQAELLKEKRSDFVYGPWVRALNENEVWKQIDVVMQYFPLPKGLLADYVLKGWCNITQSALFKTELIEEAGYWREDLMPHEDYEFWFRIGKLTKNYHHENKSCVIYRQHKHQITDIGISDKVKWLDGLKAREIIEDGINYKPSLFSLLLFKGNNAHSKSNFIKTFGIENGMHLTVNERVAQYFYRIQTILTQIKTGTSWQKMHGINKVQTSLFNDYINQLP